MKRIIAALCILLSPALAALADPYHEVTFSAVQYFASPGKTVEPIPINNTYLIEQYAGISKAEAKLYDVVEDDLSGNVYVILKTGSIVSSVMTGTAITGKVDNGTQTEYTEDYSFNFENNGNYTGASYAQLKYNEAGDLLSANVSFSAGDNSDTPGSVLKGTFRLKPKTYNF